MILELQMNHYTNFENDEFDIPKSLTIIFGDGRAGPKCGEALLLKRLNIRFQGSL